MIRLLSASLVACLVAGLVFAGAASAQTAATPLEARHDPAAPVLPHAFGEEITPPEQAIAYLRELEAFAPDRMRVFDYAQSWEGRPLAYAVIARPDIMADLDRIRADLARLADPRGLSDEERDAVIARTPPVVWLSYGVHGNEISSTDAGLRTAHHLIAAQNDPVVETVLDHVIVIIDPVMNPDGRARFIQGFNMARGLEADPWRYSAEHDEAWPGGRSNHYFFDMNRDWFAMSQPETQGRVAAMQEWWPVVVVDAHEMGGDETYFFAPSAEPFNPQIVASQRAAQELIGRNHAQWFDRLGYRYFTREVFDAFYPGYGDMWPTLHGAIAMTYEQASARGLVWRRNDGSVLTYGDGVEHHFIASLSTAQAVAENRTRFLSDFTAFRAGAINESDGPSAVVFSRAGNRWGAERLARLAAAQGIQVMAFDGPADACGARFPEGGFMVRFDQGSGRLARTLFEEDTPLPAGFMAEQEARRDRGLNHQLYDVTAWSLPLMFNVEAASCRRTPNLEGRAVDPDSPIPARGQAAAGFGYVIPWTDAGQARFVAALAREGVVQRSTDTGFSAGGRRFPRGSVVIRRSDNGAGLDAMMTRLAAESGARFEPLDSSWVEDGPNLGSDSFRMLRAPRIALVWGEGTSSLSVGATRYILEQRYGLPVSVVRTGTVGRADFSRFDAVILPEQGWTGFTSDLGSRGKDALEEFVEEGGTLIALGDAVRWAADPDIGLLPARRERGLESGDAEPAGESARVDGRVIEDEAESFDAETPATSLPDTSPGALVRVTANPDSWLSAGYDSGAAVLATGRDIYAPISRDEAQTALRFAGPDDLVASGYLWEEYQAQLAFKPFAIVDRRGAGHVVGFTQDPTVRAYQEGLDLLLLNAVLLGPAHSGALR